MTDRAELQKATVIRLREQAEFLKHSPATWQLMATAANEIDRLLEQVEILEAELRVTKQLATEIR